LRTLSGNVLSDLHDEVMRAVGPQLDDILGTEKLMESAMRAVGPQLDDILGTKELMESAMRAVGPQLDDILGTEKLVKKVDTDAVLSDRKIQQVLGAATRVLVPPSPEVQQKIDEAAGVKLGDVTQPACTDALAARTLFYTKVGVVVMIVTLIVSVVVAVHDWRAQKATDPIFDQETHANNDGTTVNITNAPAAPQPCSPHELSSR
jgi:hypothetical protein